MKKLYKNTFFLGVSGSLVKFISIINGLIIARYLGPEQFGMFSIAREFANIFSPVTDFGSSTYFIKEGAVNNKKIPDYLGELIVFKLVLSILVLTLGLTIARLLYADNVYILICIFMFAMVAFYFFSLLNNVYMARNTMVYTAKHQILFSILLLIVVLLTLILNKNIYFIVWGRLFVTVLSLIILYIIIRNNYGIRYNFTNLARYKILMRKILPYGGYVTFFYMYSRVSTIILSKFATNTQVGYFSSAYQIILGIYFIPAAFLQALFPMLSRKYAEDGEGFNRNIEKALKILSILGIIISSILFIFSFYIVDILYGEKYLYSYRLLQIGAFSFYFRCINTILADSLTTSNNQKYRFKIILIDLVFIVFLSTILSYLFSSYGTMLALLISEIVSTVLYIRYVNKYVKKISIINLFKFPLLVILFNYLIYLTFLRH